MRFENTEHSLARKFAKADEYMSKWKCFLGDCAQVTAYTRRLANSMPQILPYRFRDHVLSALFPFFPSRDRISHGRPCESRKSLRLAGITHGIRLSRMKREEDLGGRNYVRELQTTSDSVQIDNQREIQCLLFSKSRSFLNTR